MSFLNPTFSADGVTYRDGKRHVWLASLLVPIVVGCGPLFYLATGSVLSMLIPLMVLYVGIPIADAVLGVDLNNPPEEVVPELEEDPYYRGITYALVPVLWVAFLGNAWFVGTQALSPFGVVVAALNVGFLGAFAINLGHELGHKKSKLERNLASTALAISAYGHFAVEHNRGHHLKVATPEDCASSRMGETLYSFALRELPGGFRRGWELESKRLEKEGKGRWSTDNEILRAGALTLAVSTGLVALFGATMVPFLLLAYGIGGFHLTLANYIEHYGLLRRQRKNGSYERCKPHHSWNSNHICSNWVTFHLQRHSDHHANPGRRYQSLRDFDDLPSLPSGYPGMFLLSLVPPLWFRVMDPILIAHVKGDPERIHFQPGRRDELCARYGLGAPQAPAGENLAVAA